MAAAAAAADDCLEDLELCGVFVAAVLVAVAVDFESVVVRVPSASEDDAVMAVVFVVVVVVAATGFPAPGKPEAAEAL